MPTTPIVCMRLVQEPFRDVAIGLAQVVVAAYVEPVLADQIGGDRQVAVEEGPDQVGGVEVLSRRDQVDEPGLEQVDPRVDREFLSRLFLHSADASPVQGELAVPDV